MSEHSSEMSQSASVSSMDKKKKKRRPQTCRLCKVHGEPSQIKNGHKQHCKFEKDSHALSCEICVFEFCRREILAINQYMRRSLEHYETPIEVEKKLEERIEHSKFISKVWKLKDFVENCSFSDEELKQLRRDEPQLRHMIDEYDDQQLDNLITQGLRLLYCCFPQEEDDKILQIIDSFSKTLQQKIAENPENESMDGDYMSPETEDNSEVLDLSLRLQ